jgi:hypothetical protein
VRFELALGVDGIEAIEVRRNAEPGRVRDERARDLAAQDPAGLGLQPRSLDVAELPLVVEGGVRRDGEARLG